MAEKLKCPFCGTELQHWGEDFLYCENLGCPMSPQIELPISIWQALIDGKKAQDALEDIIYFFDVVCQKDEMHFYDLIDNNIKKYREIASITEQEE